MTTSIPTAAVRSRQLAALAQPAVRVVPWQPLARMMTAGIAFIAIGSPAGVSLRVSVASAAVAATSAFLLDDPAAMTIAASPTPLAIRRVQRIAGAVPAIGLWWLAAVSLATYQGDELPRSGRALEFCVFVAVALAASATAAAVGDRTAGGIAGAMATVACFATTFLPERRWLPFPTHPDAPGATTRLLVVLAAAIVIFTAASRDPARP